MLAKLFQVGLILLIAAIIYYYILPHLSGVIALIALIVLAIGTIVGLMRVGGMTF